MEWERSNIQFVVKGKSDNVLWIAFYLSYKKLHGWSIKFVLGCNGFEEWLHNQPKFEMLEIEKTHGYASQFVLPQGDYEIKYNLEHKLVKPKTSNILSLICNIPHIRILKCINFRISKFKWKDTSMFTNLKELYITCSSEHERSKISPHIVNTINMLCLHLNVLYITYCDVYPYYPRMLDLLLEYSKTCQIPNIFMGMDIKYKTNLYINQNQYTAFMESWNTNITFRINGVVPKSNDCNDLSSDWYFNIDKSPNICGYNIFTQYSPCIILSIILLAILFIRRYFY